MHASVQVLLLCCADVFSILKLTRTLFCYMLVTHQLHKQQTIATWVSQNNVPQAVVEYGSDVVFLALFAGVAYSVIATAAGQTPDKLPLISGVVQKRLDRCDSNALCNCYHPNFLLTEFSSCVRSFHSSSAT
jgi:hypothetical protein